MTSADRHSRVASLYDRYLDAMLRGDEIRPSDFGEDAVWLEALHDLGRERDPSDETPPPEPNVVEAEPDLPFERLGDYRLLRRLGEGGMGVVYMAEQISLGRLVALKILRPELAGSASAMARFEREARAAARLHHPGIVGVHSFGTGERGVQFLTMDLLPGRNLDAALAEQDGAHLGMQRLLTIGVQLAEALHAAHEAGVVHRDVKPGNVRLLPGDRAMLLDFGLARDLLESGPTLTSSFAGSPQYAAPEQVDSKFGTVGPHSDVYGLGATLYECACGRPPFASDSVDRVLAQVCSEEPPAPRKLRADLPRDLDLVLRKALEKESARRYATMAEFAADLRAIAEFRNVSVRPSRVWTRVGKAARRHPTRAVAVVTLLVVAVGLVLVDRLRTARDREFAKDVVAAVHEDLDALEARRLRVVRRQFRFDVLTRAESVRALNPGEARQLQSLRALRTEHTREREQLFERSLLRLREAAERDPEVSGLQDVRARLYYQRWLEVRKSDDPTAAELCLQQMAEHDVDGVWRAKVDADGAFSMVTAREDVPVYLFRYARLADVGVGTELRIAAMRTHGPADPMPPGRFALRIVRPPSGLRSSDVVVELAGHPIRDCMLIEHGNSPAVHIGDRLLAVAGQAPASSARLIEPAAGARVTLQRAGGQTYEHVCSAGDELRAVRPEAFAARNAAAARVWRDGEVLDVRIQPGGEFRTTASPHLAGPDRRFAATPIERHALAPGWYLAVLRAPGCEELRLPFHVDNPAEHYARCAELSVELWPVGSTPPGFARVASDAFAWREAPFFIAENEVTCGEYLAFLRDESVRTAEGFAALWPRFGPLAEFSEEQRGATSADGELPEAAADLPVTGISWHSAHAYVAWLNRTRSSPPGFVYDLPAWGQWERASKGGDSRKYVFGNQARPEWIGASSYGRGELAPVRSHPIDESPYGVYDLAASVREWCADESQPGSGLRVVAGGSFKSLDARSLEIGRSALPPGEVAIDLGLRVVMRQDSGGDEAR